MRMIETAIISAAGFGKRMGLLTTFFLKEMFPLGRLPMIEHTIIELKRSGIKGICVVIRKGKELIEEYLKGRGYKEIEISFAYQRKALGIGDALRRARNFVGQTPLLLWPFQTRCFYQKSLQHDNYWSRERKQREYDTR